MKYIEEFKILGTTYGISKASEWMDKDDKGYKAWYGGGGIGDSPTIYGCRKIIHRFATHEAKALLEKSKLETVVAQGVLKTLGDDVFNLGAFLQP